MLGRECVPERDRVPSLQCYGYPLEQEHGLLLLVGYLSDSSFHFGDKLDCFLVPRSSGFNCYWRKLSGSLPVLGTSLSCCLRLGLPPPMLLSLCRRVRVGVGVRDGDVPRHWLAPCPWDERGSVWPLAVRTR